MSNENKFAKLGVIYAIGQVMSKAISFILLPIYVNELGMVGYGQLALVDTVLDFISSFTIVAIYSGYIRFYRDYEDAEREKLKNTALNFAMIMSLVSITLALTLGKVVCSSIFNFENSHYVLILVVFRSIISQLVILLMCDYTLNYRAGITVTLNFANLLLNLMFTIVFVVLWSRGIIGVYEGYILSNIFMFIYLMIVKDSKYRFEMDLKMLKNMLKFSAGFIPSCMASTVLTLSDRYFLRNYRSFGETGIYSVGYKFGMLIEPLFVSPFRQIFTPYKLQIWKEKNAEEKFNAMFIKYHVMGCFVMLGICMYSKTMILLLSTADSIVAYKIVPFVVISYFLYGMSIFYSLGIELKNKTYLDGFVMIAAGIVNIILNILLIPSMGMYGAALATAISYIVMNLIYLKFSMPLYYIKYKFDVVFKVYGITFVLYLIYYIVSVFNIPTLAEMLIGMILLSSYLICCIYLKLIKKEDLLKYLPLNKKGRCKDDE
ncbi:oligosaccharide flippase family protein [Clostridium sp. CF012]|uniref:oligosaccharide flippase family protein n=1 Tax=Clostridium sp. CF012 TaxID=2843319 RepID=UPI001C0C14EF|nr:oligosaccharide flippase family protein [Clostridium sp. CF012]MBU3142591.1 oligosaccharide flippase family protein [Clostridium sp. CF012]